MDYEARRRMEISKPFGAGRGRKGPRVKGKLYLTERARKAARRQKVRWNVKRYLARKKAREAAERLAMGLPPFPERVRRPRTHQTEEERIAAQRAAEQRYYARKKARLEAERLAMGLPPIPERRVFHTEEERRIAHRDRQRLYRAQKKAKLEAEQAQKESAA